MSNSKRFLSRAVTGVALCAASGIMASCGAPPGSPQILGADGVSIGTSSHVGGVAASAVQTNGILTVGASSTFFNKSGILLGPSGSLSQGASETPSNLSTITTVESSPAVLAAVDPSGAEAATNPTLPSGCYLNNDPTTLDLNVASSGNCVLASGTYYVCKVSIASSGKISVVSGGTATIYIDSPGRAGSQCSGTNANQNGRFYVAASARFANTTSGAGSTAALTVYQVGTTPGTDQTRTCQTTSPVTCDFIVDDNATVIGGIDAPYSLVALGNNAIFTGGISAAYVNNWSNTQHGSSSGQVIN